MIDNCLTYQLGKLPYRQYYTRYSTPRKYLTVVHLWLLMFLRIITLFRLNIRICLHCFKYENLIPRWSCLNSPHVTAPDARPRSGDNNLVRVHSRGSVLRNTRIQHDNIARGKNGGAGAGVTFIGRPGRWRGYLSFAHSYECCPMLWICPVCPGITPGDKRCRSYPVRTYYTNNTHHFIWRLLWMKKL